MSGLAAGRGAAEGGARTPVELLVFFFSVRLPYVHVITQYHLLRVVTIPIQQF